jgi:CBS domain-containing protein
LDGGNILKAIVWKITGNPNQGVLWASRFGQAFGGLAILTGISGVFFDIGPGSFWTLLIGWFLWQNAGMSAQSATVQDKLSSLRAEDAVLDNSPVVSANLTLREFANDHVIGQDRWTQFLATDSDGKLLGTISVEDLKKVLTSLWTETQVLTLVKPWADTTTIKAEESLLEVVKVLDKTGLNQLPVVRDNGTVVGILEKKSIVELLQKQGQT